MKYLAISFLLLSGCTPSPMDKAKQDFVCRNNGGVYSYSVVEIANCRDGTNIDNWTSAILTKEFYPKDEVK